MSLEAPTFSKTRAGIAALTFAAVMLPFPIGTAARPESAGKFEIETGDDFVLTQQTLITGASFWPDSRASQRWECIVEVYRVFPADSTLAGQAGQPTSRCTHQVARHLMWPSTARQFSAGSSSGSYWATIAFSANNSVRPAAYIRTQYFTGGNGPVTGRNAISVT